MHHITASSIASVLKHPSVDAEQINQLLYGEPFRVTEPGAIWSKGITGLDDYEGYVANAALASMPATAATHRVKSTQTHAYAGADIKLPVIRPLWRGSLLRVVGSEDVFSVLADGSHVPSQDIAAVAHYDTDWTMLAKDMIGTPYLWGGRSCAGIDCSGLVQIALQACGMTCPRDTGEQKMLGSAIGHDQLQRGDLVFFPGHVGIMADTANLLHANAHHMRTVVELLSDVVARLLPTHAQPVTAMQRISR